MTDEDTDICGVPTEGGDGPPCQNRAGENGRCWIPTHNNPDAENPQGRDFKITPDDHAEILEAARIGASKAGCARAVGVDKASLLRYLEAHDEFRTEFARARSRGEQRLLTGPLEKGPEGHTELDGSHARFILSTSFDYEKTEKRELEDVTDGDSGFGTTAVLDSEYVDE